MVEIVALGWLLLPLLFVALAGVGVYFAHIHILDNRWYEAIARAGGVAFQAFAATERTISDKAAVAKAAMAGLQYLQDQMATQIAKRGLTSESVQQIVFAELTRLFGQNPLPPVNGTSSVTATAAPGQEATATVSDVPPRHGIDVPKLTAMSLDR